MCDDNKSCSCGCSVKKLNESMDVKVNKINDDILSVDVNDGLHNITFDIERYPNGDVSCIVNDDANDILGFEGMQDLIAFMGNDSDSHFGTDDIKKAFFNPEVLHAVNDFSSDLSYIKEAKEFKTITLTVRDPENTIEELLNSIKRVGSTGHSFDIVIDPGDSEFEEKFFWDGDGADFIDKIDCTDKINESDEKYYNNESNALEKNGYEHGADIMKAKAVAAKEGRLKDGEITEAKSVDGSKMDKDSREVFNLLVKYHKANSKFKKMTDNKFAGFTAEEAKLYRDASEAKNKAWALARKKNIDSNEILKLDKEADKKVNKLNESGIAKLGDMLKSYNELVGKMDKVNPNPEMKDKADANWREIDEFRKELNMDNNMFRDAIKNFKNDGEPEILEEARKVDLKLTSNTKREMIKKSRVAIDAIYCMYDMCEKLSITDKAFIKNIDNAFEGINELLTTLVTQNTNDGKK